MWYSLKYTDKMPDGIAGYAKAWFIRIRPQYRDDVGILKHEEIHVKQFYRSLGFSNLMHTLLKKSKLRAEVEAYREQLKWPPAMADRAHYLNCYAGFIADKARYGLDISVVEARRLLE